MDGRGYVSAAREQYVGYYRRVLEDLRAKGATVQAEAELPTAGRGPACEALCADAVSELDGKKTLQAILAGMPAEGAQVGSLTVGGLEVSIFPLAWEQCTVRFRLESTNFDPLDAWFGRWRDLDEARPRDTDGLRGIVHHMLPPAAEGAGWMTVVDFGSAPVAAFEDMLRALETCGARDVRVGQADLSAVDPEIRAGLEDPHLTRRRLTELVAQLLEQHEAFSAISMVDDETIRAVHVKAGEHELGTGNLFLRLQRVPVEARVQEVVRTVASVLEAARAQDPERAPPDLAQLRPVIKSDEFVAHVEKQGQGKLRLVTRRLCGDLAVVCVWDMPNGMRFVMAQEPETYGLSVAETVDRAVANYRAAPRAPEVTASGPLLAIRTGDSYDASLLLDDKFWEQTASRVKGTLLACAPIRALVLATGTEDEGGVGALAKAVAQALSAGDHAISPTVLKRVGGQWEVFAGPGRPSAAGPAKPWWRPW
jgi:uncharacterized protein YtpQ (UPF0354 family)